MWAVDQVDVFIDPSSSITALQTRAVTHCKTTGSSSPWLGRTMRFCTPLSSTSDTHKTQAGRYPSWETRKTDFKLLELPHNCRCEGGREGGVSWVLLNNRWVTSPLCWMGLKTWAVHSYFCSVNFNQTQWVVEWRKFFVKLYWKINIQT